MCVRFVYTRAQGRVSVPSLPDPFTGPFTELAGVIKDNTLRNNEASVAITAQAILRHMSHWQNARALSDGKRSVIASRSCCRIARLWRPAPPPAPVGARDFRARVAPAHRRSLAPSTTPCSSWTRNPAQPCAASTTPCSTWSRNQAQPCAALRRLAARGAGIGHHDARVGPQRSTYVQGQP